MIEPGISHRFRQHAIHDDAIDRQTVQREIDECPLRFAQHHFLGIGDQPDAGDLRIFEQFRNPFQSPEQLLDIAEVAVRGQLHRRNAIGHRPHGFENSALEREDVLHVPFERGGHADEAHGFGGGRAIEHDHLVTPLAPVLIHVHHRAQLFHAGQNGQLLGLHVADAGGAQDGNHIGGDLAPVPLDLLLDVDLLDGEVVVDRQRIGGLCPGTGRFPDRRRRPGYGPDRRSSPVSVAEPR